MVPDSHSLPVLQEISSSCKVAKLTAHHVLAAVVVVVVVVVVAVVAVTLCNSRNKLSTLADTTIVVERML
jgi:hypothetical protein